MASLPRRGFGFGNRLFVWARCRVFSEVNRVPMLAPAWVRLSVGPLLRGGVDYSSYRSQIILSGIFRPASHDIVGLRRLAIMSMQPRLPEPETLDFTLPSGGLRDGLIVFEGLRDYFARLNGWESFLLEELRAITNPARLRFADKFDGAAIAINVRAGNDFMEPPPNADRVEPDYKTPMSWFVRALNVLRKCVGLDVPAYVVSDGTAAQLSPLLSMRNVQFVRPGCAISDLLVLAKCRVLLASGSSSFSEWASFLGQMPTISVPGQPMGLGRLQPPGGPRLQEFDPACPDENFLSQLKEEFLNYSRAWSD